jgi:hypothetical protein
METTRPVTIIAPQIDEEEDEEEGDDPGGARALLKLQVYAPMYTALIDPPYEFPPPKVVALQLMLFTLLMDTLTPLAVVTADSLLLVFVPEVQAYPYPPRYTENDPPYTCAKTCIRRQRMHNGDMIEGAMIVKALTLEPIEAAAELANVELLMETTRPVTEDEETEEDDDP